MRFHHSPHDPRKRSRLTAQCIKIGPQNTLFINANANINELHAAQQPKRLFFVYRIPRPR